MTSLSAIRAKYPQYDDMSDGDLLMGLWRKDYSDMHPRQFLNSIDGTENAHVTIKNPELKRAYREAVKKPMQGESAGDASQRTGGSLTASVGDPGGTLGSVARSALQGITFGAGDEIVASGVSALTGRPYEQELQRERDRLQIGRDQAPVATTAAEITGAMALPLSAMRGATTGARAAKGAGAGALTGGIYGFGSGEGGFNERAENAAQIAAMGGLAGAAAPVISNVAGRVLRGRNMNRQIRRAAQDAPDNDALRATAEAKFKAADATPLARSDFADQAGGIFDAAKQAGFRKAELAPKSAAVLDEVLDEATQANPSMTLGNILDIRKQTQAATGNFNNPFDQTVGISIRNAIDDVVDGIDDKASAQLKEARAAWKTLRKTEKLDEIFANASQQASGFENGLRTQFRAILRSKKRRAEWTEAELTAMRKVVKGSTLGNLLRKVGKFGFGRGAQSNVLSGTAANIAMGPAANVAGQAALMGAESVTARNARMVQDLVRAGGLPNAGSGNPQVQALLEAALRRQAATSSSQAGLEPLSLLGLTQQRGAR